MLVDQLVYVEGDSVGLQNTIGLTPTVADKYARKWIELLRTDAPYSSVRKEVLLGAVLAQITPSGVVAFSNPVVTRETGGQRVVGVRGLLPLPAPSNVHGTSTLEVSATSPTVPLAFRGSSGSSSSAVSVEAVFKQWGVPLSVTPPAGAVPFSSLKSS